MPGAPRVPVLDGPKGRAYLQPMPHCETLQGPAVPPASPEPDSPGPQEHAMLEPPDSRLPRQLTALKHRNYRLFFSGQLISVTGTWIQNVAQGWLVLLITDPSNRALLMGVASAIGSLPVLLFSLPAGLVADRVSKRNLLLVTQSSAMMLALALGELTHTDRVTIGIVIVIGFLSGTVNAFDAPTRQSFVIEMVGRRDLMNAIALNSAMFNGARIAGPAVAGVLIALVGLAGAFFINGASYIAVIIGLMLMRIDPKPAGRPTSALKGLGEGLRYIRINPLVKSLLALTATVSIFAVSYSVLMPIFVNDYLKGSAKELGYLVSSVGIGALLGALTLSSVSPARSKGKLLLTGNAVLCVALLAFSYTRQLWLSMCILPAVGWGMMTHLASTNTLIQLSVPDRIRGRVMSAYTLTLMGMAPIGNLSAGVLAQYLDVPWAIRIGAVATGLCALALSGWVLRGSERVRVRMNARYSEVTP